MSLFLPRRCREHPGMITVRRKDRVEVREYTPSPGAHLPGLGSPGLASDCAVDSIRSKRPARQPQ